MPREQADESFVWDMLRAARRITDFVRTTDEAGFLRNVMVQSAIERQVEILGEAANRVSREFRAAHPQIPWLKIIAQRNVLAHDYGEIDERRIWELAVRHVPDLIARLEPLLPAPPSGDRP